MNQLNERSNVIESAVDSLWDWLKSPKSGVARAEGLPGSSKAFLLAQIKKRHSGPVCIISSAFNSAEILYGDLKYFERVVKSGVAPVFFPSWEILPYENISPLKETEGERLSVLSHCLDQKDLFLVTSLTAYLQAIIPPKDLASQQFPLAKGDCLERELLETCLADNGYNRVSIVEVKGDFSVRGDIVDFYMPSAHAPHRVEFFGDEIEAIRQFDGVTQVSIHEVDNVSLLPVKEICPSEAQVNRAVEQLLAKAQSQKSDDRHVKETIEQITQLRMFSGMERYLPFYYDQKSFLMDYLPENTLLVIDEEDAVLEKMDSFSHLAEEEFALGMERGDTLPLVDDFFMGRDEFFSRQKERKILFLNSLKMNSEPETFHFNVSLNPPFRGQFENLVEQAVRWEGEERKIITVAPTKGQAKRLQELQDEYRLSYDVDQGVLSMGFEFPEFATVFIAEHEIFGRGYKAPARRKPKSQSFQRGFKDLKSGDYLVHVDYGIGQYMGTRELTTDFSGGEFLELLFADKERLYVPMEGLGLLQKYVGAGEGTPPLSKLGGVAWKRQTGKIKKALQEMAGDLLKLYAVRELAEGHAYRPNAIPMQEFADSFEYVETEDQLKAIEDIEEDLEKEKPMDRLVCGDVGYGKTEVAMRAAFKVAFEKKQVAVLVPTTLLAQQHFKTFLERFKNVGLNIASLSRFVSAKEQKLVLKGLKNGEVDILIGTHRILSKDVEFADLGLVIIDEEQRFGVKHKEKLKKLRSSADILTLTATPIPRTLHFSLMGVRDLSVIETPPRDRMAIKTYIRKFDEQVIKEAIEREMDRQGQVFFVHNKVHSIHSVAEMIRRIVPKARIGIGHGQMPEKQLENVMRMFIDKEIDILLCTTIVESGLDIPAANTIIINRSDQFGLAQLYQLRGRVGRYRHQAYAYLLIPGAMAISTEARQRITAIQELNELGAGFQLAARDMEIRGVGNMLGHKQSGHISSIGFDMYCKLMDETVKEIHGQEIDTAFEPEVDLMIKGFIPKDYIPDLNQRLEVYRRIQLMGEVRECEDMEKELADRYGPVPSDVKKLLGVIAVKAVCRKIKISKIELKGPKAILHFLDDVQIDIGKLTENLDSRLSFISEFKMGVGLDRITWQDDLETVQRCLQQLTGVIDAM